MALPPPKCGEIGAFYPVFERLELSAAERHTTKLGHTRSSAEQGGYDGCVPPFTHSALKRAIRLMIPAVRRQLHMDPHGSNMHLSKQNQQVSDICSQS